MSIRAWWGSFVPVRRRHAAIDRRLFEESSSDQSTPGSPGQFFPCFVRDWKTKMLMLGLSDNRALVGRWGERRKERWEEGEAEGVQNVRTRSLGDHSPGSPSVWQLWKFIAIDFVISSLSIGSTWAHWWIARKLFLQSCCFLFYILVSPLLQCL